MMKIRDNLKQFFDLRVVTMLVVMNLLRMGEVMKMTTGHMTVTMIRNIVERDISLCSV